MKRQILMPFHIAVEEYSVQVIKAYFLNIMNQVISKGMVYKLPVVRKVTRGGSLKQCKNGDKIEKI
jgi:hypothetical protein